MQEVKYEFCWICLGIWQGHDNFYKCNRFDPTKHTQENAYKGSQNYFIHYFSRFRAHHASHQFATKQLAAAEEKMREMMRTQVGYDEMRTRFLREAVELVIECRRVLKWTYVYGYYLPKGNQKDLFEFLQDDLERNTEHLSELTEKPIEQIDRMELLKWTGTARHFLQALTTGLSDIPVVAMPPEPGKPDDAKTDEKKP